MTLSEQSFCPRCLRDLAEVDRFCPHDGEPVATGRKISSVPVGQTREVGNIFGGRYEIRGFLGKGAMAKVYLAEDLHTGKPVALKVLANVTALGENARGRFFREARAATSLVHPNIVQILDVGVRDDGMPYLVLEFLFGESLGQLLRREERVHPAMAFAILRQAAKGLEAAHAAKIIHRDVKPDNMFLVGEPGDPYAVKLLDFGLAKLDAQSGFTQAGTAVGTIEYMAPEQTLTERPDARTDIYGLGVVMFRMFTGALPFTSKDSADLMARQLALPAPLPSSVRPEIPERLERVILMALRKRPDNRYASMAALLADLDVLAGHRDAELTAGPPAHEPDIYQPKTAFGKHACLFFHKKLGLEVPDLGSTEDAS